MPEQRFAVIDLGSNTIHLLVAESDGQTILPLLDLSAGVRLGQDVDGTGAIGPDKLAELLTTLQEYQLAAAQIGVSHVYLLATQAIRAATNCRAVCDAISEAIGSTVEVLLPEQEALLSFMGAAVACLGAGLRVVLDIGGGSMQVAVGTNDRMQEAVSLPLGSSRVANLYLPNDPPTEADEKALRVRLAQTIAPVLPVSPTAPLALIGVGGTLRRLPALLNAELGERLPAAGLAAALYLLRGRSSADITLAYEVKPERARLLLPAILVLDEVWRGYGCPPITIAAYGMREGAVLRLARREIAGRAAT